MNSQQPCIDSSSTQVNNFHYMIIIILVIFFSLVFRTQTHERRMREFCCLRFVGVFLVFNLSYIFFAWSFRFSQLAVYCMSVGWVGGGGGSGGDGGQDVAVRYVLFFSFCRPSMSLLKFTIYKLLIFCGSFLLFI